MLADQKKKHAEQHARVKLAKEAQVTAQITAQIKSEAGTREFELAVSMGMLDNRMDVTAFFYDPDSLVSTSLTEVQIGRDPAWQTSRLEKSGMTLVRIDNRPETNPSLAFTVVVTLSEGKLRELMDARKTSALDTRITSADKYLKDPDWYTFSKAAKKKQEQYVALTPIETMRAECDKELALAQTKAETNIGSLTGVARISGKDGQREGRPGRLLPETRPASCRRWHYRCCTIALPLRPNQRAHRQCAVFASNSPWQWLARKPFVSNIGPYVVLAGQLRAPGSHLKPWD